MRKALQSTGGKTTGTVKRSVAGKTDDNLSHLAFEA
jgi:hypothetical protein